MLFVSWNFGSGWKYDSGWKHDSSWLDSDIEKITYSNPNYGRAFMNLLTKCKTCHDAWYVFQRIRQPNVRHYSKMISICKWNSRYVEYFLKEMKEIGMKSYILKSVINRNEEKDRTGKDWLKDHGRAIV